MLRKVQRNAVAGLVLAGILMGSPLLAAGNPMQGSLVPTTPYDSRIALAGVLSIPSTAAGTKSPETLFIIAKGFRSQKDAQGKDHWQTPQETEARRAGDCEDKALWLFAQLKKNGFHKARLVVGRQRASSGGLHVWVVLESDSDALFYVLDPTNQKRIWKSTDFSDGSYRPLYSFDGSNRYRHDS
jgi:hypothetical protein